MEMNTFGWAQRKQTADSSDNARLFSNPWRRVTFNRNN